MLNKLRTLAVLAFITSVFAAETDQFEKGSPKTWSRAKTDAFYQSLQKIAEEDSRPTRRMSIISGNQIRTMIFDYGSVGAPNREPSLEWLIHSTHGYAYEFGPLVGIEVPVDTAGHFLPYIEDVDGNMVIDISNVAYDTTFNIVVDGLIDGGSGYASSEKSSDGDYWTWEPVADYGSETSSSIPLSHKPESWPESWPSWPGTYQVGASTADQAAYYVMDDRYNKEFSVNHGFYAFPEDSTVGGLGLRVEVRAYQWSNPLANDAIFFLYSITNTSNNDYEKVVFGMSGDPHIGGSSDYSDDYAFFDHRINMVYGYDADARGDWGGVTGWLGYMFLESPGNPHDGLDNDGDGMVDESMSNGIDDDNDWNIEKDDVGVDGIGPNFPSYPGPDFGEGDGMPTAGDPYDPLSPGEPNFDGTDLDESDQIGLTSFNASEYGSLRIEDDVDIWSRLTPYTETDSASAFTDIQQNADNVFLYGSGYFPLRAGETKRFSVGLLMGRNEDDLFKTAATVQLIYNLGYKFAKAPDKPNVEAYAGDGEVLLYWDDVAEYSWDPFVQGYDFEGYSIYRATDPGFSEVYTITDNRGNPTLYEPLARFDLIDEIEGPSDIGINGLQFDLGSETGLVHEYTDTTALNGVTYYYAVVPYDFGSDNPDQQIPPSESPKIVNVDAFTREIILDINTVMVTPQPEAVGTVFPSATDVEHKGLATGSIDIEFKNPKVIRDGVTYQVSFGDPYSEPADTVLSVTEVDHLMYRLDVTATDPLRISKDHPHVLVEGVLDVSAGGASTVPDTLYQFNPATGRIQFDISLIGHTIEVKYMPQKLWQISRFADETLMPVFDGIKLHIANATQSVDADETGWLIGNSTYSYDIIRWGDGYDGSLKMYPHDYEITWRDSARPGPLTTLSQTAPFIIMDVTDPDSVYEASWFLDGVVNGEYDFNNTRIGILTLPSLATANKALLIDFIEPVSGDTVEPVSGDIFKISIGRPFTSADTLMFTANAAKYEPGTVDRPLDKIGVVPNPYRAQSIFEGKSGFAAGRGDRQVQFMNLPPQCTIRIYTIAGDLVYTINHNASFWDSREPYNLLNKENMEIAFGVYLWHVDASASGLGTKTGKFAVIK